MNSHVEVFCGITHSQAQHAAALEAIERALVQRQATISDVVAQVHCVCVCVCECRLVAVGLTRNVPRR